MILFLHRHDEGSLRRIDHHFNDTKHIVQSDIFLANIYCNRNTIIDDMLLYSIHISTLLHYFSLVPQVFTKYRLSFKLSKYDFFLPCVEYVRHDLIAVGNCPTLSKFQLVKHWSLSPHGVSLHSFIGVCAFYRNNVP